MQWSEEGVKKELLKIAGEMESGVGNINSQFAMFRYETTEWTERIEDGWSKVTAENTLEGYAKKFLIYMEVSKYRYEDWEQQRRIDAARIICDGMQG